VKAPSLPANEVARLAELRSYEILDTGADSSFDALTKLAAEILQVPIALVSLVDAERQWFKSNHGLAATHTSRELSFCGHVVADGAPLVVHDALADARFADNPLVTGDPRVRFYAGVPLRTSTGVDIGTLCAIDHVPRELTQSQMAALTLLAGLVMAAIEAHRNQRQLVAERAAAVENAHRFSVLFAAMAEGVVVQDRSGVILASNGAAERILGLTIDQINGRSSTDPSWRSVREDGTPFPGEEHPAMVTLQTGEPARDVIMGVHKPGGALTWISINSLPLRRDGEAHLDAVLTTFRDITEARAVEAAIERLGRQERLVTMGTLTSGIGHEINNPLTFIHANVEFALDELRAIGGGSPSARIRELIDVLVETREGSERIRKIVHGLRALGREESEPVATQLEGAVSISVSMAAHELRTKATLVTNLVETPPVLADESRLSQVLVNLIVNAAQAFNTGDLEKNRVTVTSSLEADGRVCIAVSDNGPGVPADLRRRIFDPFFTTKGVGHGTGLGLSISQTIVTSLGGEIVLDSDEGAGSTFRVYLPVAAVPSDARDSERRIESVTAGGRVLVIDDEPLIVSIVRRVLGRDHLVEGFTDGRDALKLIEAGARYDVIFCDLMMPTISGDEFYMRVRAIDPILADHIVFVTGGSADPRVQRFLARVPNERIEKPISVPNLRGIARRFKEASSAVAPVDARASLAPTAAGSSESK
jgi:PAS domain S-box-containing protein